jgi:hypothetical protein
VIQHPLIAEQLDLVNLEGLMENPFQGLKVLVFVKNLGTQISLIEGVIQSASFVGSRWPWHSGVPGLIAKTRASLPSVAIQRGLTPLISLENTLRLFGPVL